MIINCYNSLGGYMEKIILASNNKGKISQFREIYKDIEIFVSMNKNFFNSELENVEKIKPIYVNGKLSLWNYENKTF